MTDNMLPVFINLPLIIDNILQSIRNRFLKSLTILFNTLFVHKNDENVRTCKIKMSINISKSY